MRSSIRFMLFEKAIHLTQGSDGGAVDGRVPDACRVQGALPHAFRRRFPVRVGVVSPAASFRLVSAESVSRGADDTRRAAWSLGAPPRAKTFDSAGAPSRLRDPRFDAPAPPPQTVARPPRRPEPVPTGSGPPPRRLRGV